MSPVALVTAGRSARGFADGFVSVLLARYLLTLGFGPARVGAIVTATLLGSAAVTLAVGLTSHRRGARTTLLAACVLMTATGLGFAGLTTFWPLLVVAAVGTLNPTAGDVSVFLPVEQALIATRTTDAERPAAYARYNLAASLAAAAGALASALPDLAHDHLDVERLTAQRLGFVGYAAVGALVSLAYARLPREQVGASTSRPLSPESRRRVLHLAALFSLDSAGGGLVVTSLLVLWLELRFDLAPTTTAQVFFAAGLLSGTSQLVAARLARRIGLVRTMVFTHLPANALLGLAAFAPTAPLAVAALLGRAFLSQMDVPARQAFVMSVVAPEERPAAASVTNVPRSLAAAATPYLAGTLLAHSSFGWPLVLAALTKGTYDLIFLHQFRLAEPDGSSR
jgi:MFS family permease